MGGWAGDGPYLRTIRWRKLILKGHWLGCLSLQSYGVTLIGP